MTRAAALLAGALALAPSAACPIVDDDGLPGALCDDDDDCGADLACIDVGDGEGGTCLPEDALGGGVDEPPVGCEGKPDGDDCSDGDACTVDDACDGGLCRGDALVCGGVGEVCSGGVCIDLGQCTLAGVVERVTNTPGVSGSVSLAYDVDGDQLAAVFDDDVTGISEIYFQLLDPVSAEPVGPAVALTDGRPVDANDVTHPSFQPSIVYASEQREFGVAWTTLGGGFAGLNVNAFATTVTATGVPTTEHDVVTGLAFSVGPAVIGWTGASYGVAWVDDRNGTTKGAAPFGVYFAPLEDDASLASFSNRQLTDDFDEADGGIALAFNARTTSFITAYRVEGAPGALLAAVTNVDGEAPVTVVVSSSGNPFDPGMAVTSAGTFIAWKDDPEADGLGAIVLGGVGDDNRALPSRTVSEPGENCGRPSLAAVPGGLALAYAADNAGVLEVRMRIIADDGAGAAGPFRVIGAGQRPSTATLPTGVGVAWQTVNGAEADIFASAQCLAP